MARLLLTKKFGINGNIDESMPSSKLPPMALDANHKHHFNKHNAMLTIITIAINALSVQL
eukprot:scaffold42788_cov47-Prasinocladus_malaysianus.AAC.2